MVSFLILILLTAAGATYAVVLKRGEERRQQWRCDSRAAWVRS